MIDSLQPTLAGAMWKPEQFYTVSIWWVLPLIALFLPPYKSHPPKRLVLLIYGGVCFLGSVLTFGSGDPCPETGSVAMPLAFALGFFIAVIGALWHDGKMGKIIMLIPLAWLLYSGPITYEDLKRHYRLYKYGP